MLTHLQRIQKLRAFFSVPKDLVGPEAFRDLGFLNILELKLSDERYMEYVCKLDCIAKKPYSATPDERQDALCRVLFPEEYINDVG
jgi:hypothetical protein